MPAKAIIYEEINPKDLSKYKNTPMMYVSYAEDEKQYICTIKSVIGKYIRYRIVLDVDKETKYIHKVTHMSNIEQHRCSFFLIKNKN